MAANISHIVRQLAETMPTAATAHSNYRSPGSTSVFKVRRSWSVNHYSMPGVLTLPQSKQLIRLAEGDVVLFPPDITRSFSFQRTGWHRVLHLDVSLAATLALPLHWPGGAIGSELAGLIDEITIPGPSQRTCALAWRVSWLIDRLAGNSLGGGDLPPAVEQAVSWVARHLGGTLSVEQVVAASGCSHNQLLRLFHRHIGCTIATYIARRRAERARELLLDSDMPITAIAAEVGIPDRQHFNKTIRRHLGAAPSTIRHRGT